MLTTTRLTSTEIADLAVAAIRAEADLPRNPAWSTSGDRRAHRYGPGDAARVRRLVARGVCRVCLSSNTITARRRVADPPRRDRPGRGTGHAAATGGVNTHRGALWRWAAERGTAHGGDGAVDVTARLAAIPDPHVTAATSHGAQARRRYGVGGAAGEAQAGFPHVRLHALPALRAARGAGADEGTARLTALLALMATLDDTCVLHRGGPEGLRACSRAPRPSLTPVGSALRRDVDALPSSTSCA